MVLTPKKVLAVGAHPDDIEVICGGTLTRWAEAGTEVVALICTDGSVGTKHGHGSNQAVKKTRQRESHEAAKILKISQVEFLRHRDGQLSSTHELKNEIVKAIKRVKPEVVVSFDPTLMYSRKYGYINHTDHRVVGEATMDAVFPLARDKLAFPDHETEDLMPHIVSTLLMYNPDNPNHYEDISDHIDAKLAAFLKHKSQYKDAAVVTAMFRQQAHEHGADAGFALAEPFVRIDFHP